MPAPLNLFTNPEATSAFVGLLRSICDRMKVAFSANEVNRSLSDLVLDDGSATNPNGDDWLNQLGDPLGIRFRFVPSTFRELIYATSGGAPLLVRAAEQNQEFPAGHFVILGPRRRGRWEIQTGEGTQWVSQRWLKRNSYQTSDGQYEWFLPQTTLSYETASAFHYRSATSDQPLKPFSRLLSMLKLETADVRTVLIFSIVMGILSLSLPLAVEAIVNTIAFGRYLQPLVILALMVFVFLAFRAGISVLMHVVVEYMQRRIFVRFVDDVANRLVRVPLVHFRKYHGPELVNRFFDIVTVQKVVSKLLLDTLMLVLQTIIGLGLLAFYHPFLLGYDIGLLIMMTVVLYVLGRGAVRTAIDESGVKYQTAAWLQQMAMNPLMFKFGGSMGFAINQADETSAKYIFTRSKHFRIVIRQFAFSMVMQTVAATVLLGLGGYLVIEKQITLGQLVAAELIVTVILGSFAKIGKDLESFYDLLAAVDKVGKLMDMPVDTGDRLHLPQRSGPCSLELVELKFKSSGDELNQQIEPGQAIAIVGRTGAGKSRLIEVIAGQYPTKQGFVRLNEFRVDSLSFESLQAKVAFVREVAVFEASVADNIRLGRRDVSSEMLTTVIDRLGLQYHVSMLPEGLETKLQNSGYPLSSGAAIRLNLARALVSKPSILLVDGLIDRLPDDDIADVLARLESFKSDTTMVIGTGRVAVANWADSKIEL